MSHDASPEEQAVVERIAEILVVLSEVASNTYQSQLEPLPETDPFSVLYNGINEMVRVLADAQHKNEQFQKDLTEKLTTIEQQRMAIRELSTPVIEVWEGVLCLPVVGVMDTSRSSEMTEAVLRAVVEKKAACTIIDVTGIEVMDTGTADHFLRMAKSIRLLGAECVITGISPGIAQTIVHMGVDLTGVKTHRSLRDALAAYIARSLARAAARAVPQRPPSGA